VLDFWVRRRVKSETDRRYLLHLQVPPLDLRDGVEQPQLLRDVVASARPMSLGRRDRPREPHRGHHLGLVLPPHVVLHGGIAVVDLFGDVHLELQIDGELHWFAAVTRLWVADRLLDGERTSRKRLVAQFPTNERLGIRTKFTGQLLRILRPRMSDGHYPAKKILRQGH
jgi:hypothetical protein